MTDLHTRRVLDLTIRLAEVMLSSGSGTADVVATARDVAQAYRLSDCVIDITSSTITVSALPASDGQPVTIVRSVRARSTDYTRLNDLDLLVGRITSGGVGVDQAHEAMDELSEQPHPYPRWLATAGWAGFALGVAVMLGGTWLTCILAAITAATIDRLGRVLNRLGTPFFFQHAVGAGVATLVAVAAYRFADQGPTTLVATGIVLLLSGMTLVGSVQDALTGYMITAVGRLGDALFLTAGIVVGILGGLQLATFAGVEIDLYVDAAGAFATPTRPLPIILAVVGAALAGLSITVASYAPLRSVGIAGLVAGLAELVLIGLGAAGFGPVVSAGIAAVAVGIAATVISIRRRAPALVIATAGITPMLPGLAIFRAVFAVAVDERFNDGLGQMLAAAATALALGSGVVMGEFLVSPLRFGAGRLGDRLRVEGPPGLRRAVGRVVRLQPAGRSSASTATARSGSVPLEPAPPDEEAPDAESSPEQTSTELGGTSTTLGENEEAQPSDREHG